MTSRILMILFWVVLTITYLWWAVREYLIARRLHQSGTSTSASVVELGKVWWTRNLNYYVIYKFTYRGEVQEIASRKQSVGWIHYGKLRTGGMVEIKYLPSNPQVSRLAGVDTDNTSRDLALLSALVCILACTSFFSH